MFKDRLREARKKSGLSQEKVGVELGISKQTISDYERGYSEPDMATISKLMNILNVDANYLWQDEMKSDAEYSEAAINVAKTFDQLNPDGQTLLIGILEFAKQHHSL